MKHAPHRAAVLALLAGALGTGCDMAQQAVQKGLDRAAENIADDTTGRTADQVEGACRKDTDCKGERVCMDGACMDVSGSPKNAGDGSGNRTAANGAPTKHGVAEPGPLPSALPELDF